MLIALVIAAGIIAILRCLPVRSVVLIEGVFSHTETGWSLSEKKARVYYFDKWCRDCFENTERRDRIMGCQEGLPRSAWKLGSVEPQRGDSIKILCWKNILGGIVAYKIEQTNFSEEFSEKQFRQYREEWDAHLRAWDSIQAEIHGLTLERYRALKKEKNIQEAARMLDMTPEQVLSGGRHERLFEAALESRARHLSKESGKTITAEKLLADYKKRLREQTHPGDIPDVGCEDFCIKHRREYVETGTLADAYALGHLTQCDSCTTRLNDERRTWLSPAGSECFSDEELAAVKAIGMLPKEREPHVSSCYRCRLHFNRKQDEHMASPPGPECLTSDDLHNIHANGNIPETRRAHIQNCKRCSRDAVWNLQQYVDRVAPQPSVRLQSLRRTQEIV